MHGANVDPMPSEPSRTHGIHSGPVAGQTQRTREIWLTAASTLSQTVQTDRPHVVPVPGNMQTPQANGAGPASSLKSSRPLNLRVQTPPSCKPEQCKSSIASANKHSEPSRGVPHLTDLSRLGAQLGKLEAGMRTQDRDHSQDLSKLRMQLVKLEGVVETLRKEHSQQAEDIQKGKDAIHQRDFQTQRRLHELTFRLAALEAANVKSQIDQRPHSEREAAQSTTTLNASVTALTEATAALTSSTSMLTGSAAAFTQSVSTLSEVANALTSVAVSTSTMNGSTNTLAASTTGLANAIARHSKLLRSGGESSTTVDESARVLANPSTPLAGAVSSCGPRASRIEPATAPRESSASLTKTANICADDNPFATTGRAPTAGTERGRGSESESHGAVSPSGEVNMQQALRREFEATLKADMPSDGEAIACNPTHLPPRLNGECCTDVANELQTRHQSTSVGSSECLTSDAGATENANRKRRTSPERSVQADILGDPQRTRDAVQNVHIEDSPLPRASQPESCILPGVDDITLSDERVSPQQHSLRFYPPRASSEAELMGSAGQGVSITTDDITLPGVQRARSPNQDVCCESEDRMKFDVSEAEVGRNAHDIHDGSQLSGFINPSLLYTKEATGRKSRKRKSTAPPEPFTKTRYPLRKRG